MGVAGARIKRESRPYSYEMGAVGMPNVRDVPPSMFYEGEILMSSSQVEMPRYLKNGIYHLQSLLDSDVPGQFM